MLIKKKAKEGIGGVELERVNADHSFEEFWHQEEQMGRWLSGEAPKRVSFLSWKK